ncbi:hypothetical protein VWZ88_01290 [Phaeobacter sp. JH20_36]|uniref:hypothetical protein n=1 Tax=unclassified Phaeobacter TaxID=2621772 RepID=UPI003A863940
MADHPEGPESEAIEALRLKLLPLLTEAMHNGMPPSDAASAAVAAGATVYAVMTGGIKPGMEADAVQVFGTWVVDNISAANQEGWPAGIDQPCAQQTPLGGNYEPPGICARIDRDD